MGTFLTGTYRLIIQSGKPTQLIVDEEFIKSFGVVDNSDPERNYSRWREGVHPDDLELIDDAISSTINNIQTEIKYRWFHKQLGNYTAVSSAGLAGKKGGTKIIFGIFKGYPEDSVPLVKYEPEVLLMTKVFAESLFQSFHFCALTDIAKNKLLVLNDRYNISSSAGMESSYDDWFRRLLSYVHPDDRRKIIDKVEGTNILHALESFDEVLTDFRFFYNGSSLWLNMRCVNLKRKIGGIYPNFIVIRKINADHRTLYSEELRNQLIEGLSVPYLILDLINLKKNSYYSSFDNREHGVERLGDSGYFSDAVHRFLDKYQCSEEDRNAVLYNFSVENMARRFSAGEKIIECEICRRKDSKAEWLRLQAFMTSVDEFGDPAAAILTVQQVTAEKMRELRYQQRLERALRSESQYRQAILSNAAAVYTYNITKDVIYEEIIEKEGVDPLLPLLGLYAPCSYDEYINRKSEYFTDKATAEQFRKTFCTKTLRDMYNSHRRSFDTEYEFMYDGQSNYFREAVILTQDLETGDIWGLTYVRDITEEHYQATRVEQALRDAFDQAQHANSAKTLFMSQMSHDIRTPLNSILGMSAIAREHIDNPDRVTDCLEKIEASGRHLLEIVNNVLDLSAIESGKTVLASEPFDLQQFLEDTMNIVRPLADKKQHTLVVKIAAGMNTAVVGDPTKLRQLLTNIIGNAIKYTPDGGEIVFSAVELEHDHHEVCRYLFSVKDNGIGMNPEFTARIFDPFVRADDKRVSGIQGTGLGMPIARNIAHMMNGDISINSAPGKGSQFDITVCLKKNPDSAEYKNSGGVRANKRVRMSDYDFGGKRVLLAEDLDFNAEIASEFLAEANIITEVASDGEQAVEMFSRSQPGYYSLIFMDIQMTGLDGYQAAKKIRELSRPDAKEIPIIAMTANAFLSDIQLSKEHGMNGHISKPLDIPLLCEELCKWIPDYKINKKNS